LADGCWHLPRFELPETLWEGLDRRDAPGSMAFLKTCGPAFHLHEVVYSNRETVFDGPGDFQLMLRADLERINGFDERMVSGWHVDSNMSRRMALLHGEIRSLLDHCFAYHCDHTRMAGLHHGRDRVENDLRRFYENVVTPEVAEQAETWGLAGVALEEFRLSQGSAERYRRALTAALPAPQQGLYETSYQTAWHGMHYPPAHVLPYLCESFVTLPRHIRIAWFGVRRPLLELFLAALPAMGFHRPVMIPDSVSAATGGATGAVPVPEAEALRDADVFVFEFGCDTEDHPGTGSSVHGPGWVPANMVHWAPVRRGFFAVVDHERAAITAGAAPRRIVTVNATQNPLETMVHEAVSINRTPLNTRVRQGFVIVPPVSEEEESLRPERVGAWLQRRMGRRQPIAVTEPVRLLTFLRELIDTPPAPGTHHPAFKRAGQLLALLDHPGVIAREDGTRLAGVRAMLVEKRPSALLAPRLKIGLVETPPDVAAFPGRLAAAEDWEDDRMIGFCRRYFNGAFSSSMMRRSQGLWARLNVLVHLQAADLLQSDRRVLVVARREEGLCDVLSELCGRVSVLDVGDRNLKAASPVLFRDPSRVRFLDDPGALTDDAPYDAVLFARHALFHQDGLKAGSTRLFEIVRHLRSGGLACLIEQVAIDAIEADRFGPQSLANAGVAEALRLQGGLRLWPVATPAITRTTLDIVAFDEAERLLPNFVEAADDRLWCTGTWFLEKVGDSSGMAAAALCDACRAIRS
jgi:hypothetical protein